MWQPFQSQSRSCCPSCPSRVSPVVGVYPQSLVAQARSEPSCMLELHMSSPQTEPLLRGLNRACHSEHTELLFNRYFSFNDHSSWKGGDTRGPIVAWLWWSEPRVWVLMNAHEPGWILLLRNLRCSRASKLKASHIFRPNLAGSSRKHNRNTG